MKTHRCTLFIPVVFSYYSLIDNNWELTMQGIYRQNLKILLLLSLLFLVEPLFSAQGVVTGAKTAVHPDWFKESFLEIAEDVEEAAEEGKHVILFMEMNGCPYCYKMNEDNFKNAPYKAFIQEHFDVIALNVQGGRDVALNEDTTATEKEIADRFGVQFTPGVVFLNGENKVVAKVYGYRNSRDFKVILDYVQEKAYETKKLSEYINSRKEKKAYALLDHPQFSKVSDLSTVTDKPLALIFEDTGCLDCEAMHKDLLAFEDVKKALRNFTVVRVDTLSDAPMSDLKGNITTAKELAKSMGVSYAPAIVLFDKGQEKLRIQNMLYRFHFTSMLEYVGERHYEQYPENPFDYVNAKTEALLDEGKNVSISDE